MEVLAAIMIAKTRHMMLQVFYNHIER